MTCTAAVRRAGDVAIVDLGGKFTVADAPGLIRGTVAGVLDQGGRNLILNLAQVAYMDSAAGIGELVSSYTSAARAGARLKLMNAGKHIDRILHLLRLDTIFEMYNSEDAALESFRKGRETDAK